MFWAWQPIYVWTRGIKVRGWDVIDERICDADLRGHPTSKPERLIRRLILYWSNGSDLIADFFGGGGPTFVVADRLGRKFFGCDINPDYVEMALKRLEKDRAGRQLQLL